MKILKHDFYPKKDIFLKILILPFPQGYSSSNNSYLLGDLLGNL